MERSSQQKAIDYLIHQHAGAMALISGTANIVKKEIEKGNTEEALKWLSNIKRDIKKANDALDYYYAQFKNDFK